MPDVVKVIKAYKRTDRFDNKGNLIPDNEIVGTSMTVIGRIPESYIKYIPNRIFDRRKYPELYAVFQKDHLPSELELELYEEKMKPKTIWQKLKKWFKLHKLFFKFIN